MHRRVSIIVVLLIFLSASYTQAKNLPAKKISAYDAAKSHILQNISQYSSNSDLGNADLKKLSALSSNIHRNRYYQPKYGRFTSKDPIGFRGDSNLYRYANDNPVLFSDPMGLFSIDPKLLTMYPNLNSEISELKQKINTTFKGGLRDKLVNYIDGDMKLLFRESTNPTEPWAGQFVNGHINITQLFGKTKEQRQLVLIHEMGHAYAELESTWLVSRITQSTLWFVCTMMTEFGLENPGSTSTLDPRTYRETLPQLIEHTFRSKNIGK